MEGEGWSMKAKVLCVMVRRLKVGGFGGWRVEGGRWRVVVVLTFQLGSS